MYTRKNLAILIALLVNNTAFADIVSSGADINTTNNVPVVNINTPGADGVSHNTYSQFDIGQQGAILNNSAAASQSVLAGAIAGNANITGDAAKIILNEVNSADKSVLNGMLEVAGSRADVVVANKAGITCNGCGFINAGNGLLTTGEMIFEDGKLSGYKVNGGEIAVEGKGLLAGDVDYTAILARTAKINASIHAKDLTIAAGKNEYTTVFAVKNAIAAEANDKPDVLIDVSELGGMYAGKITLVANEKGLGINTAGNNINNNVIFGNNIKITHGNISTGIINGGSTGTSSGAGIKNKGTIQAGTGGLNLNTASLNNAGPLLAEGDIALNTTAFSNANTMNSSNGNVAVTSTSFTNDGNIMAEGDIALNTTAFSNDNTINSSNGNVAVTSTSFTNDGNITADSGKITMSTTSFKNNETGIIRAASDVSLNTTSLKNSGRITSVNSGIKVNSTGVENSGTIKAHENVEINGTRVVNSGDIESETGTFSIDGNKFINTGNINVTDVVKANVNSYKNTGKINVKAAADVANATDVADPTVMKDDKPAGDVNTSDVTSKKPAVIFLTNIKSFFSGLFGFFSFW